VILVIGVVLVAALIARHSASRSDLRMLSLLGALALGVRLVAIGIIAFISITADSNATGVWLNDEASYFRATDALMPTPWNQALPLGLDHLGGSGYLGLTTAISLAVGGVDALAFRMADVTFGTIVVLLCAWLGQTFFGRRAGLLAGIGAALWPDLVLWSATMVRDTLGSLAVVGVWWVLVTATRRRWLVTACFVLLALLLLATLRTYLAVAVGTGVVAWLAYPVVRRQQPRALVIGALGVIALASLLVIWQWRRIDAAEHELLYRQTTTRMETLGRLYRDLPTEQTSLNQPLFGPGTTIALPDPQTGWLLTGLVEDSAEPGFVNVRLTDDTSRRVPISDVVLLQDARIPPLQLFSWLAPSALAVFAGLPATSKPPNAVWVAAAVTWDGLLVLGVLGLIRSRLQLRDWLFPLCVMGGTIVALMAIPGDPGNAERHRATQTLPLLLVVASGVVGSRGWATSIAGRPLSNATSMPISATTAVASSTRSAR
jgi:hypothetical protein